MKKLNKLLLIGFSICAVPLRAQRFQEYPQVVGQCSLAQNVYPMDVNNDHLMDIVASNDDTVIVYNSRSNNYSKQVIKAFGDHAGITPFVPIATLKYGKGVLFAHYDSVFIAAAHDKKFTVSCIGGRYIPDIHQIDNMMVVDIDKNGIDDIVISFVFDGRELVFLMGNADGSFTPIIHYPEDDGVVMFYEKPNGLGVLTTDSTVSIIRTYGPEPILYELPIHQGTPRNALGLLKGRMRIMPGPALHPKVTDLEQVAFSNKDPKGIREDQIISYIEEQEDSTFLVSALITPEAITPLMILRSGKDARIISHQTISCSGVNGLIMVVKQKYIQGEAVSERYTLMLRTFEGKVLFYNQFAYLNLRSVYMIDMNHDAKDDLVFADGLQAVYVLYQK